MNDEERKQATRGKRLPSGAVVGVGIGSAALVAALLYAGKLRNEKGRKQGGNG